ALLERLEATPQAGRALLPAIDFLADHAPGPVGTRARVVAMRIGGHRKHVVDMAIRTADHAALRDFDPERAPVLILLTRSIEAATNDDAAQRLRGWRKTLAAGVDTSRAPFLKELEDGSDPLAAVWLDLSLLGPTLAPEVTAVVLRRLSGDDPRDVTRVCRALLRSPVDWPRHAPAIGRTAASLLEASPAAMRLELIAVVGRDPAAPGRAAVLTREAAQDTAAGIAAAALLARADDAEAKLVGRFAKWPEDRRVETLRRVGGLQLKELVPILRDRIVNGTAAEVRATLLKLGPHASGLGDELRAVAECDDDDRVSFALQAIAAWDPRLEDERNAKILAASIRHAQRAAVRLAALRVCRRLSAFPEPVAAALRGLIDEHSALDDYAVLIEVTAVLEVMAEIRSRPCLPLLARLARSGGNAALQRGYLTPATMRAKFLRAVIAIDPEAEESRLALRAAAGSRSVALRLRSLNGFMRIRAPQPADRVAVTALLSSNDADLRRYSRIVLDKWGGP
ncbi:MAG: hypothetical protein OER88_09570, partial [Planctomycetota bacterium]|nr:hypothetical protein [Planctomycetota bacterium]